MLAAPAAAGSAPTLLAGGQLSSQSASGYTLSVVDPTTGQEVIREVGSFEFEYEAGAVVRAGVNTPNCNKAIPDLQVASKLPDAQTNVCGDPPRRPPQPPPGTPPGSPQPPPAGRMYCQTIWTAYKIYIVYGPTLLTWKFSFRRCWDGTNVRTPSSTDSLLVSSPAMRVSGTKNQYIGPAPASVVTMRYEGHEFVYCPLVVGGVQCIAAFHPRIEFTFLGNGGWLNQSYLG
ncbi:hypothetical protein GCM10010199_70820 [Dactylosporangium roseum]